MNTYTRPHVKHIISTIWRNVTINRLLSRRFDDAEAALRLMQNIIEVTIKGNATGLTYVHALTTTTDNNVKQHHFSLMNDQLGCVISGIIEVNRGYILSLSMHDEWNEK